LATKKKQRHFARVDHLESTSLHNHHHNSEPKIDVQPNENRIKKALEDAIDNLSEKYRTVFVMRELEGLNVSETSEYLGVTEENVNVRFHRAKRQLKDILEEDLSNLALFEFKDPRCNRLNTGLMKIVHSMPETNF